MRKKQNSTFTHSNNDSCARYFFVLFSVFARQKITFNENVRLPGCESGIHYLGGSKLAINPKKVRDTKFGRDVSNEMLLNAAKSQCYNFCCFWFTQGKLTGG